MTKPLMPPSSSSESRAAAIDLKQLAADIRLWGRALGFDEVGIADIDLSAAEPGLHAWLEAGWNGNMEYMARHGTKRSRPDELVPGTVRVICVRMPYLPAMESDLLQDLSSEKSPEEEGAKKETLNFAQRRRAEFARLEEASAGVVSVYARGNDYHDIMRQRLRQLAKRIEEGIGPFGYRVFVDSAPVLEVELARKANLGWRGKHTLLLHRDAGSFFFLGEIFVDIPLPTDAEAEQSNVVKNDAPKAHCGSCTRCIDACPTGAIVAPYRLDARLCISYLTIELKDSIPIPLRPLIGNRIYGCDDCQLVCPWNKFAKRALNDFDVRNGLDRASLIELFEWTEEEFKMRLAHSPILRIGHARWLRNIAVALGNALRQNHSTLSLVQREAMLASLKKRLDYPNPLVVEHVQWALEAA